MHFITATEQPAQPGELFSALLPMLLVLAGIAFIGWIALLLLRRSTRRDDQGSVGSFTLEQLRRMHENGELDAEEYQQARTAILGQVHPGRSDTTPGATAEAEDQLGKED